MNLCRYVRVLLLMSAGCAGGAVSHEATIPILEVAPPTELTPMTVNAVLMPVSVKAGETASVLVGVRLLLGWHTYVYVPAEEPYIQTTRILELGPGVAASGEWIAPPPVSDIQNPKVMVYESRPEPLIFLHSLRVAENASGEVAVRAGLIYQTCNSSRCLPPAREIFDLKLTVAPK